MIAGTIAEEYQEGLFAECSPSLTIKGHKKDSNWPLGTELMVNALIKNPGCPASRSLIMGLLQQKDFSPHLCTFMLDLPVPAAIRASKQIRKEPFAGLNYRTRLLRWRAAII